MGACREEAERAPDATPTQHTSEAATPGVERAPSPAPSTPHTVGCAQGTVTSACEALQAYTGAHPGLRWAGDGADSVL
ncbi:MAG: hypothetical protein QF464_16575, partial [Myxococcota bacterium]|nr:hypothetical protein [Myxococcota bacterium]